jgi:putative spermidine/putrescine transport system permease protein
MALQRYPHGLWLRAFCGLIVLFLLAPILVVVVMSFSNSDYLGFPPTSWSLRWYRSYLDSPEWIRATMISLQVAVLTMIAATVLGTMAAYGLHRCRFAWVKAAYGLLTVPMIVPSILIAVGAFIFFAPLGLNNTITGLFLAHSALAMPLVLLVMSAGLKNFDMSQERAARSLGAGRLRAFLTVTLPQIRASITAAMLLAFITSFDEVVVASLVSSGGRSTLTKRMFAAFRDALDPTLSAIATLFILSSLAAVALGSLVLRRPRP